MTRRLIAVVLFAAALASAAVLDGRRHRPVRGAAAPAISAAGGPAGSTGSLPLAPSNAPFFLPAMPGGRALDSTWFCAAGTARDRGIADAEIVVANAGRSPARASVQLVTDRGEAKTVRLDVPAAGSSRLRAATALQGDWVAATVIADRGEVAANLAITHEGSVSVTPCASRASDVWNFAAGSTERGATETLAFYNPYPEAATVKVQLDTEDGVRQPPALQGIPVPPHSLVVARLNDVEDHRSRLAATVTAPIGRIVAARIQSFDGTGPPGPSGTPPKGVVVTLGVPNPSTVAAWPYGTKGPSWSDRYVLLNPGPTDAKVSVDVGLTSPATNGRIASIPLTIGAGEVKDFDASGLRQIPDALNYSVTIRSTNGVPFVAERRSEAGGPGTVGVTYTPGSPLLATRWVIAAADVRNDRGYVTITNPGRRPVEVRLGGPGVNAPPVEIAAGDRRDLAVDPARFGATPPLFIEANHPVLVGYVQQGPRAMSAVIAVPDETAAASL